MNEALRQYLCERYEEEIRGDRFFGTMQAMATDVRARRAFAAMAQLERETGARIGQALSPRIPRVEESRLREADEHGRNLVRLPWLDLMRRFLAPTQQAAARYAEAEASLSESNPGMAGLLAQITRHERAYVEFIDAEIAGNPEALAPVLALLEGPRGVTP
jgi:hypothetical protein